MRSAVVTGAGQGIGLACAERLADEGWFVVGVVRRAAPAAALRERLADRGAVVEGDVTRRDVLERAAGAAAEGAPLGAWVSNAAVVPRVGLDALAEEDLRSVMATNLDAAVWGAQLAVRAFLASHTGGSIVNVSSIHGRVSFPDHLAYDVSKGALDALTRNVAVQYGPYGIRANSVAPGPITTPHLEGSIDADPDEAAARARLEGATALRRIGAPEEVAAVVAFLAGDGGSYVTGQTIYVDGGWSAQGLHANVP
jgi:NAD(P)-dependent dehydrogenase (short-subunit alcohol dehydrogenase family)